MITWMFVYQVGFALMLACTALARQFKLVQEEDPPGLHPTWKFWLGVILTCALWPLIIVVAFGVGIYTALGGKK